MSLKFQSWVTLKGGRKREKDHEYAPILKTMQQQQANKMRISPS
jgi:hypothetical protein